MPLPASEIGTMLAIAVGVPTTENEVGYEAMTWVDISGISSIGAIGDSNSTIDVPDLATGRIFKVKAAYTGGSIDVVMYRITSDAGQIAVRFACASPSNEYSWRISDTGITEQYFSGPATSWVRNERSTTSNAGFSFTIEQNTVITSGT